VVIIFIVGNQMIKEIKKIDIEDKKNFIDYFAFSVFIVGFVSMFTENISMSSQNIFYPLFWISVGLFYNNYREKNEKYLN
jgi:hypothetical protein